MKESEKNSHIFIGNKILRCHMPNDRVVEGEAFSIIMYFENNPDGIIKASLAINMLREAIRDNVVGIFMGYMQPGEGRHIITRKIKQEDLRALPKGDLHK